MVVYFLMLGPMAGINLNFISSAMDEDLQSPLFEFITTTTGLVAIQLHRGLRSMVIIMTGMHSYSTSPLQLSSTSNYLKLLLLMAYGMVLGLGSMT